MMVMYLDPYVHVNGKNRGHHFDIRPKNIDSFLTAAAAATHA